MSSKLNVAGIFEAKVVKPENGWIAELENEKQTPFVRLPLEVTSEGPYFGQYITAQIWLSEPAFDKSIARLTSVFDWDGDLPSLALGKKTFEGMPCNIETEIETTDYNGKPLKNPICKVKWLNPPGGGGGLAKPIEETKLKGLLNRLAHRAKAVAKQAKATSGTPVTASTKKSDMDPDSPDFLN